jgi:hypothetical protein
MRNKLLFILGGVLIFLAGYMAGNGRASVAYAQAPTHGGIPKAYGHLVSAVVTPGGTSLVFEDSAGTIRFVTMTGQVESELDRK